MSIVAMERMDQHYGSHAEFYQAEYASVIRRITPLSFATMLMADQTAGDWSDKPTPDLLFARIVEGRRSFSVDVGAGRFNGGIRPNDTLLIGLNTSTSIQCAGRHRLQIVALPFARLKNVVADDLRLPEDGDFGALHAGLLGNSAFGQMVGAMFEVVDHADPAAGLFFDSTLMSLVAMLVMEAGRPALKPLHRGGLAAWQVRRVIEMMEDQGSAGVSLSDLAAEIGLSTFHFCRAFKQATGVAPHRQQTLMRLERAQALLADTPMSIIEVALSVGYDTSQGLGRLFQRELGVSPSQYRRTCAH
jgi:AraC family transcriptional regulator